MGVKGINTHPRNNSRTSTEENRMFTLRYGAGVRTVETFKGEVIDRNRLSRDADKKLTRLIKLALFPELRGV
jgi:hypothetical protein